MSPTAFAPTVAAVLLLAIAAPACAGPYEIASTSTAKGLKIKSNVQFSHSGSRDSWVLPKIGVGGRLRDNLELSAGTGYGVVERSDGWTRGGMRDLAVSLKWRLRDEDADHAALTIEPQWSLPTGDDRAGIGKGAHALSLPLMLGRQYGRLRLTGMVSASRTFGRGADQVGGGALLEYFGGPQWSCGMELVADAPRSGLDRWQLRANVGAKRRFGKHAEWQVLAGRTVENRRGDPTTVLKLAYEYKF